MGATFVVSLADPVKKGRTAAAGASAPDTTIFWVCRCPEAEKRKRAEIKYIRIRRVTRASQIVHGCLVVQYEEAT